VEVIIVDPFILLHYPRQTAATTWQVLEQAMICITARHRGNALRDKDTVVITMNVLLDSHVVKEIVEIFTPMLPVIRTAATTRQVLEQTMT